MAETGSCNLRLAGRDTSDGVITSAGGRTYRTHFGSLETVIRRATTSMPSPRPREDLVRFLPGPPLRARTSTRPHAIGLDLVPQGHPSDDDRTGRSSRGSLSSCLTVSHSSCILPGTAGPARLSAVGVADGARPYSQGMTGFVGFGLLASAFAPLVATLAVLRIDALGWVGWVILVACFAALLLLGFVLRRLANVQARPLESSAIRRADERVLGFASGYVVPVVITLFGGPKVSTAVATIALVVFMAVIYVRGGLYHLNPTLAVLGFRLYEVTASNGSVTMLLTKTKWLSQRDNLQARYLGPDIAFQMEGRS